MNCAEFDNLLTDYIDGALTPELRKAVDEHAAGCPTCRELLSDITGVVQFMSRVEDVEPPPELITRIAFQTPIGRFREPLEPPGWWGRLASKWLQPILQPRLAMGMAMTILSFAMLERCTGVHVQHIQAADISPVRIWDGVEGKCLRVKDRAVKYYENIRLVYEIEMRLHELNEQQPAGTGPETEPSKKNSDQSKAHSDAGSSGSASSGEPIGENKK